jgi:hypothetical protein
LSLSLHYTPMATQNSISIFHCMAFRGVSRALTIPWP